MALPGPERLDSGTPKARRTFPAPHTAPGLPQHGWGCSCREFHGGRGGCWGWGAPKAEAVRGCVTGAVWGAGVGGAPVPPQDSQGSTGSPQPHSLEGKGVPLEWGGSGPGLVDGEVSGHGLDPWGTSLQCSALGSDRFLGSCIPPLGIARQGWGWDKPWTAPRLCSWWILLCPGLPSLQSHSPLAGLWDILRMMGSFSWMLPKNPHCCS